MKYSVIVPAYNASKYILRCIESIIQQNYDDYELIIVNDGSTDSTRDLCENVAKEDNHIKIINKENGGVSSARNAGIDAALGDYYIFIDSDDYVCVDFFNKLDGFRTELDDFDILCYRYAEFSNDDVSEFTETNNKYMMTKEQAYYHYTLSKDITRMAWDKVWKSALFDGIRYPSGMLAEDYATTCKLLAKADKIVVVDSVLYFYNKRIDSYTGTFSAKLVIDNYLISCENYEFGLKHFPGLKRELNTEYLKNLMMTCCRASMCDKTYSAEALAEIEKEAAQKTRKAIMLNAEYRTKAIQLLFCANSALAIKILKKHVESGERRGVLRK